MIAIDSMTLFFVGFGFLIGVLFGFFGLGGSFFVTPTLLVLGHPAEAAVGSGLVFVFGTSVAAAVTHRSAGHIDSKLGGLLILGMSIGIETGRRILVLLVNNGSADTVISTVYVFLLFLVGLLILHREQTDRNSSLRSELRSPRFALPQLPPVITVQSGVSVSIWSVLTVGVIIGTLSGFLGVGGGFLMVPSLVYGMGLTKSIAIGTDIFQIAGSSAFGSLRYLQQGAVHFTVVVPLLCGSLIGSYLGSKLTDIIEEKPLMRYFAGMLLVDSLAVASQTVSHIYGIEFLHDLSLVLLFGTALSLATLILYRGGRTVVRNPIQ